MRALPISRIVRLAAAAEKDPSLIVLRAGTPKASAAPNGIGDIMRKGSGGKLPGRVETVSGKRYQYYWRVAQKISDMLRAGEQEYLDDARRAFELTYKRIADEINALVGQRFGPADTRGKANELAEAALAAKLPKELGTNAANWTRTLDRLLEQSKSRDTKGWHYMQTGEVITEKDRIVEMVVPSTFAQIGAGSNKVVNF